MGRTFMNLYLDTAIVVYLVEQPVPFGAQACAKIAALQPTALTVSELVRLEVLVVPRRNNDLAREQEFHDFFRQNALPLRPLDRAVMDTAINLRAKYRTLKTPDAIHLATAIEAQCDLFVSNDAKLRQVSEIPVEIL